MKKLYMLTLACILMCMANSFAQTRYWRGPVNGDWNNTANWSADGISTGASVPNGTGFTVFFDQAASVNVNITPLQLQAIVVTGNITAKLVTSASTQVLVSGSAAPNYGLRIDAGSRLEDSAAANVPFNFEFSNGARAMINGTWYFGSHASVIGGNGAFFTLPAATGQSNRLDVNGTMIIGPRSYSHATASGTGYIFFNAGSEFRVTRDGGFTPFATWASTATLRVTGVVSAIPTINTAVGNPIGNLVYDCPAMNVNLTWGLPTNLTIGGNFQVLNTNNKNLILGFAPPGPSPITVPYTVNGNFEMSGTSIVTLGNSNAGVDRNWQLQVNGNFVQSGGTFNLRDAAVVTATLPTELKIKGSFTQTAGTFGAPSTANPAGTELFIVELNGASNQSVSISSGTIDNANNVVTLKMNNVNGATLVQPLAVGRINWSTNKGKIIAGTNGANALTINNPALDALTVNGAGTNAFVSGTVIRKTNSAAAYSLPTGATTYRPVEVIPVSNTLSAYSAEYFASAYSNVSAALPLYKVSNAEYWNVGKSSGDDAAVRLTLAAAVPGAAGPDKLVVAHFNTGTSKWESVKGATGTELEPGNSATGSVTSDVLTSFSPFTFGVLPGSPLPVYLVSFNAKKVTNSSAKLDWTITASSNPDRFEILRSEDGSSFSSIGTVKAAAQQLTFSFLDEKLPKKTTYYQLRMIDQQGVVTISKIVSVFNNGEGWEINSMMPTLVASQAKLNISASSRANVRLAVTDMFGRVVHQQQTSLAAGSQDVWLNLGALPAGAYQVTGYLENGQQTKSFRFIKQ